MNTLFETVKAVVTPREAAERYGLPVSPGGMARCPFHSDKTPSMKLYEDHFYCFGCGAHGDVIDLTGHLLGIDPGGAVERLAEDFNINTGQNHRCFPKQNKSEIHRLGENEAYCFSVLMDYLRLLEHWKKKYAPASPISSIDDRFVEACQMLDRIEFLADVLTFGTIKQRLELAEKLSANGTVRKLAEYVHRRKEGENHAGKQASA